MSFSLFDNLMMCGMALVFLISAVSFYDCHFASQHYCPDGGLDIPPQGYFPIFVVLLFLVYFTLGWAPSLPPNGA